MPSVHILWFVSSLRACELIRTSVCFNVFLPFSYTVHSNFHAVVQSTVTFLTKRVRCHTEFCAQPVSSQWNFITLHKFGLKIRGSNSRSTQLSGSFWRVSMTWTQHSASTTWQASQLTWVCYLYCTVYFFLLNITYIVRSCFCPCDANFRCEYLSLKVS